MFCLKTGPESVESRPLKPWAKINPPFKLLMPGIPLTSNSFSDFPCTDDLNSSEDHCPDLLMYLHWNLEFGICLTFFSWWDQGYGLKRKSAQCHFTHCIREYVSTGPVSAAADLGDRFRQCLSCFSTAQSLPLLPIPFQIALFGRKPQCIAHL
jgi:hypothetical protein